jgi:hypothetical protein
MKKLAGVIILSIILGIWMSGECSAGPAMSITRKSTEASEYQIVQRGGRVLDLDGATSVSVTGFSAFGHYGDYIVAISSMGGGVVAIVAAGPSADACERLSRRLSYQF